MKLTALRIFAAALLVAFTILCWITFRQNPNGTVPAADSARGEEVYASHDCTDCHLAPHVLKARRAKGLQGLIRVRKDLGELTLFLQSDRRHETFMLISEGDRRDLIAYLKTLQ